MASYGARGFQRLDVDERRRLLLEQGRSLFTQHPYDELSMAAIAREAGISKALLYHYFPSKQAFFVATLQDAAQRARRARAPDHGAAAARAARRARSTPGSAGSTTNRESYGKLLLAADGVPEVRELIDGVRDATAALILERLLDGAAAARRAARRRHRLAVVHGRRLPGLGALRATSTATQVRQRCCSTRCPCALARRRPPGRSRAI